MAPAIEVVVADGRQYARMADVLAQLGGDVTAEMVRSWVRRRGVRRHWDGTRFWYDLVDCARAEAEAAASGRGRPRRTTITTHREED